MLFIFLGRILLTIAFMALLGVWIAALRGSSVMGLSESHLFGDATVLALLGIGCLLDGIIHNAKGDRI